MTKGRIAVFGASGFVGGAFIEHFEQVGTAEIVPLIHSTGNAGNLARRGQELRRVDLMSPPSIAEAIRDCTHVVNCARGGKEVLIRGFQNLLDASIEARIQRLVHVSSVAAYGDLPPGTVSEDREARPDKGTYGANKLAQDTAALAAVNRGLPTVVVCPPQISGCGSPFLLDIVNSMRRGDFGLVEEGRLPCELVDVTNLAHAMTLALDSEVPADGRRIFVTDESETSWSDVIGHLTPLAEREPRFLVNRAEATRLAQPSPPPVLSLAKTIRHLLSSDVREALRKDPLFARAEMLGKLGVRRATPQRLQAALKKAASSEGRRRGAARGPLPSIPLLRQQLRDVRYTTQRAHEVLKYTPILSFEQSMRRFVHWYQDAFDWNTEWWPLLKQLYR